MEPKMMPVLIISHLRMMISLVACIRKANRGSNVEHRHGRRQG
jgi:hypothetical protein